MFRNKRPAPAVACAGRSRRIALHIAAAGLAILDPAIAAARETAIEGVRLPQRAAPATSGDSYQDGRTRLATGDMPGAIAAFRAALLEAPRSVDALNGMAVAYDRIGRYDISRAYYDTALAIDPDAVLVLNNLGYSLYLQGRHDAAMPLLQRAAASNDMPAQAAARRVLALVAVKLREQAIAQPSPLSVAEAPPQARIEVSSSGEQRLVLAAPAPPRALARALGDAAELVMVATPLNTERETAMPVTMAPARAAPAPATHAMATHAMAALVAPEPPATPAGPAEPPAKPAGPAEPPRQLAWQSAAVAPGWRWPAPPGRQSAAPPGRQSAAPPGRQSAAPPEQSPAAPQQSPALPLARDAPRRLQPPSPVARATGSDSGGDGAPLWLLAPRRNAPAAGRTTSARLDPATAAGQRPDPLITAGPPLIIDNHEPDTFAAQMRGSNAPAAPVSTEQAVARLEALLLRVRAR